MYVPPKKNQIPTIWFVMRKPTFPKNRIFLNVRIQTTYTDTQTDKVRKTGNTKRKIHCIDIETSELEDWPTNSDWHTGSDTMTAAQLSFLFVPPNFHLLIWVCNGLYQTLCAMYVLFNLHWILYLAICTMQIHNMQIGFTWKWILMWQ